MKEILEWDAVMADGTRIPINVKRVETRNTYSYSADAPRFGVDGMDSAALAAHESVAVMLRFNHDVRDLVPRGNPSRAELEAKLYEVQVSHARTESQRDATVRDHTRISAEFDDFRVTTQALINALPTCTVPDEHGQFPCNRPATKAWARGGMRYCDICAPEGTPDYPRADPLRTLIAMLAVKP